VSVVRRTMQLLQDCAATQCGDCLLALNLPSRDAVGATFFFYEVQNKLCCLAAGYCLLARHMWRITCTPSPAPPP
jgi:hypothetical protein